MAKSSLIVKQQHKTLQIDHQTNDQTLNSLSQIKINIKDYINTLRLKMRSIQPGEIDMILNDLCLDLIEVDKILESGKSEELIKKKQIISLEALKSNLALACLELTKAADWHPAKESGIEKRQKMPLDIYYQYMTNSIDSLEKSLKEGLC
ncbi:MAG: hypothetical protein LCH81_03230 [Bacteroidetes bacterium]|nr:hypothetical protein [Bacteroidota bacterium]